MTSKITTLKKSIIPSCGQVVFALALCQGPLNMVATSQAQPAGAPVQTGAPVQMSQGQTTTNTPSQTIQAAPIEINASAPKQDPDPYDLPPHAPESLVKMRQDLEKSYKEHRALANQMLAYLASVNFDTRSSGPEQSPKVTYASLLGQMEKLNKTISTTEAEFIHEKEAFLANGASTVIQTASAHGAGSIQNQ